MHPYVVSWKPRDAWHALSPADRERFVGGFGLTIGSLTEAGVELIGFALSAHFTTLLARDPDWVWTHRGSIPMQDGFLNQWHASIPVRDRALEAEGVANVQLREGMTHASHVLFDRSELLAALTGS